ncbi:MAG: TonB-dependent receptor [Acidobacteria bacterium]|nr:TonB-dependent receptor [Acidobacteriota bacterium]
MGIAGLAAVMIVAGAAPVEAQVNTCRLEITTLDENRVGLPGATIRVVSVDSGLKRVAVTDAAGVATIPALPPGTYDVHVELEGFAPVDQKGLELRVGQTARLVISLRPTMSETITVTARAPLVDVYKSDTSTNIVPEQIEQLPTPDRDFQKLAFIAPSVQRERGGYRFISGGPVIGSVGNASQSTIMVDGVDFTDQALGLARTRFSQDAIREFRVITNRFDAEIGGSAGGALSIVTRSGTNELHGSAFGFFRSDSLRSTGALESGNQDFSRYQVGFTLGGPIVRDRTHYFLSSEYIDESNITLFRPGGAFADLARDYDHPFTELLGLATLDHQATASQLLRATFVYEKHREDNFRVGGVCDISCGQSLNRDNWNLIFSHTWVISDDRLNELRVQAGNRKYVEPLNSNAVSEWFSSGTTLRIGANIVGRILGDGDYYGINDTYNWHLAGAGGAHDLKIGGGIQWIDEESDIPLYPTGLFVYLTDDRSLPLVYAYGTGSADVNKDTRLYHAFVQDEWRVRPNLTLTFGLRYDYDSKGNNPDFTHPLEPEKRHADTNNIQPRFGFTWDPADNGRTVVRGGVGLFTGRYLLVPAFAELQQNGVTGRILRSNLNGLVLGLPPAYWLDPDDPQNTGIPLPPDSTLLAPSLKAPEATQASLGVTRQLGDTGLYLDLEAIYAKGREEIIVRDTNFGGNSNPVRLNPAWNQINTYTNEGRSKYTAFIASLNGFIPGGHMITASVTVASKKNISDDFSPDFPFGYPSDPADIDAEYGRSRNDERFRFVLSGIFHLPWGLTLAPVYQYGSGQPWNHLLGYDYNGDGKNSDRPAGVKRNDKDGPRYSNLNLRLTKTFQVGDGELEIIIEAFNVFNTTNYDVNSVDQFEYLSGPTLANPDRSYVPNPNFGKYRATLDPREIQLGMRYRF